jgi:hypothetical protein
MGLRTELEYERITRTATKERSRTRPTTRIPIGRHTSAGVAALQSSIVCAPTTMSVQPAGAKIADCACSWELMKRRKERIAV